MMSDSSNTDIDISKHENQVQKVVKYRLCINGD